ncbi:MAG: IS5 family transposase [Cutibacterium acnes]|nr:MAG: IS5 family transposase [Cutibacterium acnes]
MSRFQMLSDAQWELIAPMLPTRTGRAGRPFSDARTMVEAIIYRYRCGIAWRDLPEVYGPWQTVWTLIDWSVSVDSTIARAHQHATNITRLTGGGSNYRNLHEEPADHGIGRSRGGLSTKIHQLVDGTGLPLVSLITPGQAGDSPMLLPLLGRLRVARPVGRPRTRPEAVLGDKAYSSRAIRTHLRARRIKAVIPEPADQQGHRRRRGSAGGRPVGLDSQAYKGRNVIERQYAHLKQWRGLATRYDKYAIVYRAAVVLNAVLAWSKRLSDMP